MSFLLLASLWTSAGPTFEVRTLDGALVAGAVSRLDGTSTTIDTAGGPVSLETEDLVTISRSDGKETAPLPPLAWIDLVDGSCLFAAGFQVVDGRARIALRGGPSVELSARDLRAVRFHGPSAGAGAEWSRILEADSGGDRLVVTKGDSIDYYQGVLHDLDENAIAFELDGETLSVKRSKVYGLIYYQSAGRNLPEPVARIAVADGSRWEATTLRWEDDQLAWTTPLGLERTAPPGEVARIAFLQDRMVYLSDLEPESVTWTPFFGTAERVDALSQFFAPRNDRAFEPGPLRLGGQEHAKGLAIHSRTEMTYRLSEPYRRFKAIVGIDDRVRPRGDVRLVIRGDEQTLFEGDVTGTDPPQTLDLDLAGVRRLVILVDFGGDLSVGDHLDLCEARLVK